MTGAIRSLWAATAAPGPDLDPPDGDATVGTAVVGGGIAGLSTALHLARAGEDVLVLEAEEPGWGASGRSGGQIIPGIKHDPDALTRLFGEEAGTAAARAFGSTADKVFELIDRYGIDCDATRAGWVQPAHSAAGERVAADRCRQWRDLGADVDDLTAPEIRQLLGMTTRFGGWIDRRGGSVQPLSYTRGLARAALSEGARISPRSRVANLRREGRTWTLDLEGGRRVTADHVALCANAYSGDLWPGLHRTYVAANSFQIATRPLPPELDARLMPSGIVASDTRNLLAYFRKDRDGRLLMGGRGTFTDPGAARDFRHIHRMLAASFPEAAEQQIDFRWFGRVAITQDFLPHLHVPEDGLTILAGCQGRGMALQSKMGEWIADHIRTGDASSLPIPVVPVRAIPFHELRRLYVSAMLLYYKVRDAVG